MRVRVSGIINLLGVYLLEIMRCCQHYRKCYLIFKRANFEDKSDIEKMKVELFKFLDSLEEMLKGVLEVENKGNLETNLLVLLMRIFETVDLQEKCKNNVKF